MQGIRRALGYVNDVVQMAQTLNVSAIVPTKEWCVVNAARHVHRPIFFCGSLQAYASVHSERCEISKEVSRRSNRNIPNRKASTAVTLRCTYVREDCKNGTASCLVLINPQRMRVHQLMLTWLIPKFVKKQDDFSTYHERVTELRCTDAFTEAVENQRNLEGESLHPPNPV